MGIMRAENESIAHFDFTVWVEMQPQDEYLEAGQVGYDVLRNLGSINNETTWNRK